MLCCHYLFMCLCLCPLGGSGELISTHLGIPGYPLGIPRTVCDTRWALHKCLWKEGKVFPLHVQSPADAGSEPE